MQQVVVAPMQWSTVPDMDGMDHSLGAEDAACLDELRAVLEKHGRVDRFGVTLLHRHFEVRPDECLLETVDVAGRVLMVRPVRRDEMPTAVQTQWRLSSRNPLQWCEAYCNYTGGTHNHGHQRNVHRDD